MTVIVPLSQLIWYQSEAGDAVWLRRKLWIWHCTDHDRSQTQWYTNIQTEDLGWDMENPPMRHWIMGNFVLECDKRTNSVL